MITAEDFVLELKNDEEKSNFKLATVVELFENDTAKIQFDGEEIPSEKQYAYLASYVPSVDDRVLLGALGGTYVILGKVNFNISPDIEEEDNKYLFDLETVNILKGLEVSGTTNFSDGMSIIGNVGVDGNVMATGLSATGAVSGSTIVGDSATISGALSAGTTSVSSLNSTGTVKGGTFSSTGSISGGTISGSSITVTGKVKGDSLDISDPVTFSRLTTEYMTVSSTIAHKGSELGFFGATPRVKPGGSNYSELSTSADLSDVISKINTYIRLLKSYGLS